jgi:hypothetical protein
MSAEPTSLPQPTRAEPVFVTGVGRSGTTLCGEILNAHSQLAIAQETVFLPLALMTLRNFQFTDDRRVQLERALVRLVYEAYAESQGKPRFGDKVFTRIEPIDRIFDGTPRYVWMIRHPVDVVESWAERYTLAETTRILSAITIPEAAVNERGDAYRQARVVLQALIDAAHYLDRLRQAALRERIVVCRYEDLVMNPADACASLCRFLGADYEEQMIDGARFGARGIGRGDVKKFRRAIDASSVARWQRLAPERRAVYAALSNEVTAALNALAGAGFPYSWDGAAA